MKKYLFLLGSSPDLSFAELQAIYGGQVSRFSQEAAVLEWGSETDLPAHFINRLGGTVKIAEILAEQDKNISEPELQNFLSDYFLQLNLPKIHFAISEIGRDQLERFDLIALKNQLHSYNLKVRFNDSSRHGVGAALLLHCHSLQEILLVQGQNQLLIAKTLQVQDIDDWTLRDRSKPYADHKKGMLPPKLARMMVNLAIGENTDLAAKSLYDPFCGTGTILLEAAFSDLGHLFGSDLDVRAVLGSEENLDWWQKTYTHPVTSHLFTSDVTKVEPAMLDNVPVNFLVTEPFLGKQTPKSSELVNVFRGLEKLYWGAFRHWIKILAPGATIVIVFPRVHADNGQLFSLDHLLDKLASLGYNKRPCDLFYARPQAVVEREIVILTYEPKTIER